MVPVSPDPDPPRHEVTGHDGRRNAAHRIRPPALSLRLVAALAGVAAIIAAVAVGTVALLRSPGPLRSAPESVRQITVTTTPAFPLTDAEIVAVLRQPPDYGALTNTARRASCLVGLGYHAATAVLGARPVDVDEQPGVLLILAGDTAATLHAVAVSASCSAADTGLLADRTLARPTG